MQTSIIDSTKITVSRCSQCPFYDQDDTGYETCSHPQWDYDGPDLDTRTVEMPEQCPLRTCPVVIAQGE